MCANSRNDSLALYLSASIVCCFPLRIAEIFRSVQGEGLYTGTPSVFVRTSGCNLRCWFCDTPYSSWDPEGVNRSVPELLEEVREYDTEHVVLTGGEPMLLQESVELTSRLKEAGHFITVETAGTVDRPVVCDLMSISPKLSNSTPPIDSGWAIRHDAQRERPEVIARLICDYPYQFKFVIDQPADINDVLVYLQGHPSIKAEHVYLMPQARSQDELSTHLAWLAPLAEEHGFRLSNRLHIELFGQMRGT